MIQDLPQKLLKYFLALAFVALACLVWWAAVKPLIGVRAFNGFMFVAIILAGRYAGFGPSWLALIAGGWCLTQVLELRYDINNSELPGILGVYFVIGTTLVLLTHSERTARQTTETNAQLLRQEIGERAVIEQQLREEHQQLAIEQELLRQSIELQEHERMIIAYDIHDGIIQYTTGALMFLESYKGRRKGTADAEEIEPVLAALRQAIADGRRVMNGIRPPLLDDAGVVAAIEYLASENQMATTEIEFLVDDEFGRLIPEVETALYRIAQEALFNAVKHSGSSKIQISLCRADKSIRLVVRDWGVGFDLGKVSRGVHGLSGIKERAKLLGGQSSIQSSPREGTCISVDLPLIERAERAMQPVG
jgi:signal transduction histidine kinase